MKKRFGWSLLTVVALLVAACGGDDGDDTSATTAKDSATTPAADERDAPLEEITIGQLGNLSGVGEVFGVPFDRGMRLAFDEINESGFLEEEGISLKMELKDTASDTPTAVTAFNEFVRDGIEIITGAAITPIALAISPLANEQEVLYVTGAGTSSPDEDYAFHLADVATPVETLALHLAEGGSERVAAIVNADNDAFVRMVDTIDGVLKKEGGTGLIARETIAQDDSDFSSALTNLRRENPDVVVLSTLGAQGANIIRQMKQFGGFDQVTITGVMGWGAEVVEIAGPDASGILFPSPWAPGDPRSADFEEAYEAEYNQPPAAYSALGYQAGWLVATAIKIAIANDGEVTAETVRDALPAASESDDLMERGPITDFTLAATGTPVYPGTLATVSEDGAIVAVEG